MLTPSHKLELKFSSADLGMRTLLDKHNAKIIIQGFQEVAHHFCCFLCKCPYLTDLIFGKAIVLSLLK